MKLSVFSRKIAISACMVASLVVFAACAVAQEVDVPAAVAEDEANGQALYEQTQPYEAEYVENDNYPQPDSDASALWPEALEYVRDPNLPPLSPDVAASLAVPVAIRTLSPGMQAPPPYNVTHTFDHSIYWGSDRTDTTLAITTNVPIRNLQLTRIEMTEYLNMDVLETMFWAGEEFLPNQVLLVDSFLGAGAAPHMGISFSDEDGILQRFFSIEYDPERGGFYVRPREVNYVDEYVWME